MRKVMVTVNRSISSVLNWECRGQDIADLSISVAVLPKFVSGTVL